jgi:hypothetical protein
MYRYGNLIINNTTYPVSTQYVSLDFICQEQTRKKHHIQSFSSMINVEGTTLLYLSLARDTYSTGTVNAY